MSRRVPKPDDSTSIDNDLSGGQLKEDGKKPGLLLFIVLC